MKLLYADASPFARKCRVVIAEAGLQGVEMSVAATTPTDTNPAVAAANPIGKIPCLVREDGPALFDSRVICRFVNDMADGGLYPEARLWEVLTLEALADGIMDAAVLLRYQQMHGGEGTSWIDGQWDKVARALDAAEARWLPVLQGPLHIGQISIGCALGYLDFRQGERAWRTGRPSLAAWEEQFRQREAMQQTAPA